MGLCGASHTHTCGASSHRPTADAASGSRSVPGVKEAPGLMSYDPEAAERVRRLLSGRDDVVEKKMVGGLSFLVNGNMCCGVTGTALMVRVGADGREQALREPHVRPMLLGGRVLSGFICIEPSVYAADDALASWVRRGLDFASGLPAKPVRTSG